MMSKTDDQSSVTSADISWPVDRVNHDQIVFENVADQYVKGEDVKVYFAILHDMNINPHEDQIGLIRIGSNNINECLAYASIHLDTSTSYGTAVFPSSSLTMTDDEFYQFCYINDKRKNLGSSIPFQLNCSSYDIDLLSSSALQTSLEKASHRQDSLIALADHDNEDLVVIHTKRMLMEEKLRQENRQLLVMNRRLEQENDESKGKLDLLDAKSNECINKVKNDMQALVASHKATVDELSARQHLEAKLRIEHDASLVLCQQYQSESLQFAERCRTLEGSHTQMANEAQRLRSQLSTTSQLVHEQSKQIIDLENSLVESSATANQHQTQLEQQLRDLRLTTEKHQLSMQTQIDAYTNQSSQQENQIHALETANSLLKEELKSVTIDNTFLLDMVQQDKLMCQELQLQIDDLHEQRRLEKEHTQNELRTVRNQHEQSKENQHDSLALINSVNEIKKRCLKHQKSEIEVKKQLAAHKEFVVHLQRKVQDLTDRLFAGGDEYKSLYRKYIALERMHVKNTDLTSKPNPTTLSDETGLNEEALVSLLRNSYELQQQDQQQNLVEEEKTITASQSSVANQEISECPMCYWEFPAHLTLENKKNHIEAHFN